MLAVRLAELHDLAAGEDHEVRGLAHLVAQRFEMRARQRGKVAALEVGAGELEDARAQNIAAVPGLLLDITARHQRLQQAEGGADVEAGGARDVGNAYRRARSAEVLEDVEHLGDALDGIGPGLASSVVRLACAISP